MLSLLKHIQPPVDGTSLRRETRLCRRPEYPPSPAIANCCQGHFPMQQCLLDGRTNESVSGGQPRCHHLWSPLSLDRIPPQSAAEPVLVQDSSKLLVCPQHGCPIRFSSVVVSMDQRGIAVFGQPQGNAARRYRLDQSGPCSNGTGFLDSR